jgi:nucleotide-binding universal stress UspA family protein
MTHLLLAYDGSEGARRALDAAATLYREGDAVTVVGVAEGRPLVGHLTTLRSPEQERDRERELGEAVAALAAHGIAATTVARHGDPAAAILDEAESRGAELVVLGTRGLSDTQRWLLGSVSTKVVQHARCSVLVVR